MSKGLVAFIVVAVFVLAFLIIKESANIAHKKSGDIIDEFKTVDRDLKRTNERPDSLKTDIDSLIKANK